MVPRLKNASSPLCLKLLITRHRKPTSDALQSGMRFDPRSIAMRRRPCVSCAYCAARSAPAPGVRNRLGRAERFGRPLPNPFPVFDLPAPNRALRRTENPRVVGSIPTLATTFPASFGHFRGPASACRGLRRVFATGPLLTRVARFAALEGRTLRPHGAPRWASLRGSLNQRPMIT